MSENLRRTGLKFNFMLILLFFINFNSTAKELYLHNLKLYNLPNIYRDILQSFFLENLNLSKKNGFANADIEVKWLSFNFSICFFITQENKYFLESTCFTSPDAESLLTDLKKNIKYSKYLKFTKDIKEKFVSLKIINPKGNVEKKANIISTKGDRLTDFKKIYKYKGEKGEFITIIGASAIHDIIVIPENSSAFLLQKFLNGYKIDKVYLLK